MNLIRLILIYSILITILFPISLYSYNVEVSDFTRHLLVNDQSKEISSISFESNKKYFWLFNKVRDLSTEEQIKLLTPLIPDTSVIISKAGCDIDSLQILQKFIERNRNENKEVIHIRYDNVQQERYYTMPFLIAKCNLLVVYERIRTTGNIFPSSGMESILFFSYIQNGLRLLDKMIIMHHD